MDTLLFKVVIRCPARLAARHARTARHKLHARAYAHHILRCSGARGAFRVRVPNAKSGVGPCS